MRRITLLVAIVFLLGANCFAQNDGKVKGLKDNIAKSDAAIQDAKKGIAPKTWMDRGKLFQDIYGLNTSYLRFGMTTTEAKLYFKDPKQILTSEVNGALLETYEYSQIKLIFENGGLKSWVETQEIVNDPLSEAIKSYQKATSLDEKSKNTKKINEAYKAIVKDLESKAYNEYANQKYKDAYQATIQRIDLNKTLGVTDTLGYYQAGVFAYTQSEIDQSMWKEAIDNFSKANSLGFVEAGGNQGRIYQMLYSATASTGDTAKALTYAQAGLNKYPNDIDLIYTMVNHYLQRNESQEALKYIEKAKSQDPKNGTLLFAEGSLYDRLGEPDKAVASYDAAIALEPNITGTYNPYYNKAVIFYNTAVKLMDEANNAKTNAEFEKKKELAENEFMKAIQPLEKAHELSPKDRDTMETLKTLYYRLKTKHPEMDAKYNDITKKLDAL